MKRSSAGRAAAATVLLLSLPGRATAGQEGEVVHKELRVVTGDGEHRLVLPGLPAVRGYLGVEVLALTPELRTHFGAPEGRGVLVSRVLEDTPAAAAGIAVGDVLTTVDGEPVASGFDLLRAVGLRSAGEAVGIEVWRGRRRLELTATLEQVERSRLDVGELLLEYRSSGPPGGPGSLPQLLEQRELRLDPQVIERTLERLEQRLESDEWRQDLERMRHDRGDLLRRLERLEQRLRELERRLDRLPRER